MNGRSQRRESEARLYGIVDLGYISPGDCESVTGALLQGGVDILQLRAKNHEESAILRIAQRLVPLCRAREGPLIVNDFVNVALEAGADGVHLGQEDGDLAEAVASLPAGSLVGRSTHTPSQAWAALREGASYIGFGPLFPTPTKEGRPGIGLNDIAEIEETVGGQIPVFCIGGIKPGNLDEVLASGARRVAIVSGLLQAPDIAECCRGVRERLGEQTPGVPAGNIGLESSRD